MRIGIDIDGVLAEFQGEVYRQYDWFWPPYHPSNETWANWDLWEDLPKIGSKTQFWKWISSIPDFWLDLPVIPGAPGGVYDLMRLGHRLDLITNRLEDLRGPTERWVRAWWPAKTQPSVHFVPGDKSKVPCNLYIDDRLERVEEAAVKHAGRVILFDRPYNRPDTPVGVTRAAGWHKVVEVVKEMSK